MDSKHTKKLTPIKKQEEKVKTIIGKSLAKINKEHSDNLLLSRFQDLRMVENLKVIVEAGPDKDKDENQSLVFFINGSEQPSDKKLFGLFQLLFIKLLDAKIEKIMYTIVYFVSDELAQTGFTRFRELLKSLPVKYYVKMKHMYVLHANLWVRTLLWFEKSKKGKLWRQRTTFLASIDDLFSLPHLHKRWIELVPKQYKDGVDVQNLEQMRAESIALCPNEQIVWQSIFGIELKDYEMNQKGIPELLDQLLSYFSQKPERLNIQGIFRIPGSMQEENQLVQLLSQRKYDSLRVIEDPRIVADIIKKFLRDLTKPLIPYSVYETVVKQINSVPKDKKNWFIKAQMDMIPQLNLRVLSVILSFQNHILQHHETNLMTVESLAILFIPCLMRSQADNPLLELQNHKICKKFVKKLIKRYPTLFPNMTYKLYLQKPDQSASTSSHSSTGANENHFFDEEKKVQDNQEINVFSDQEERKSIDLEKEILSPMNMIAQTPVNQGQQQQNEEDLEFDIDSILSSVKYNKTPVKVRKTTRTSQIQ